MRWSNVTRHLDWYNSSPRDAGRARPGLVCRNHTAAWVRPRPPQSPARRSRAHHPRRRSRLPHARHTSTPDTTHSRRCTRSKPDRRASAPRRRLESASTARTRARAPQTPSRAARANPHPMSRKTCRPSRRRKRSASRGEQLREERHAVIRELDPQPFRDRHTKVGEGASFTERSRMDARARNEKGHALACVIGG